jgi:hypothetical protein
MTLTVTIEWGPDANDAMQTEEDIGAALCQLGRKFQTGEDGPNVRDSGKIMDSNGNSVGGWSCE